MNTTEASTYDPYDAPAGQYFVPYSNGLATAAFVLGITSIPLNFLFVPGVLAWIFGAAAASQARHDIARGADGNRALNTALWGRNLGILMTCVTAVFLIVVILVSTVGTVNAIDAAGSY